MIFNLMYQKNPIFKIQSNGIYFRNLLSSIAIAVFTIFFMRTNVLHRFQGL